MAFANTSLTAVQILESKKSGLESSNGDPTTYASGVSVDNINKFLTPCQQIDSYLLANYIDQINSKKQQIVNICQTASGTGVVSPCGVASTASDVYNFYSSIATGIGTSGPGVNFGFQGAIVGVCTVKQDTLNAHVYPNLENGVYTTNNPLEGETYIAITNLNTGIGQSTVLIQNDPNASTIGLVVKITSTVPACATYAQNISTLLSEIETLRQNITDHINSSCLVKKYKHSYQLENWSYNRIKQQNIDEIASLTAAISVLNNQIYQ